MVRGVDVGVDVGVLVGVPVGVDVGVNVGVLVGVAVGVDVGVLVGLAVGVGAWVGVAVWDDGIGAEIVLAVGVDSGEIGVRVVAGVAETSAELALEGSGLFITNAVAVPKTPGSIVSIASTSSFCSSVFCLICNDNRSNKQNIILNRAKRRTKRLRGFKASIFCICW